MSKAAARAADAKREKIKLYIICSVLVVCLIWIVYYAIAAFGGHGKVEELNSPGWVAAKEVNALLVTDHAFADTGADVVSETPLKIRISGAVQSEKALDNLKKFLAEKAPDKDFEWAVEVLPH